MMQKTEINVNEDPDLAEDITCCHRITLCPAKIRNISVASPISAKLGQCLTWSTPFWIVTIVVMVVLSWLILYSILGDAMLPRNNGFGLYFLVLFSYSIGWGISAIPKLNLPPTIGMLIAGVIVHNCGLYNVRTDLGSKAASKIRTICMTCLVLRAGFQLSTTSLRQNPCLVLTLAIIPATFELIALALCLKYILLYQWSWSFMCGAMLTSMSPIVTINGVLILAESGYGEDKGIASIVSTGACIESVYTLSILAICFSLVFTEEEAIGKWWSFLPYGFRDLIIGIILGLCLGIFFIFFPHRSYKYMTTQRIICLVLGSLICTTATWEFEISGRGILGSLIMSFIATTGWKILSTSFNMVPFRQVSYVIWHLIQPILLGLIGADISFIDWTLSRFGLHISCIFVGLIAAFGPMALDQMDEQSSAENMEFAMDAVRLSAVTVLSVAPLSTIAINVAGPYLLNKLSYEEYERDRALSYVRIVSLQPFQVPGETVTK